jgi:hypothetical protein
MDETNIQVDNTATVKITKTGSDKTNKISSDLRKIHQNEYNGEFDDL